VTREFSQDRNIALVKIPKDGTWLGSVWGRTVPARISSHGITPGRAPCRLQTSGTEQYLYRGDGSTGKIR